MLLADVPISPNVTDPNSWGSMIERVGVPMGCLILFVLPAAIMAFYALRWVLGPNGYVKAAVIRCADAFVSAFENLRSDVESIKKDAGKETEAHEAQQAAHKALITAGHHALTALDRIGQGVGVDAKAEIDAAHGSLNQV